MANGFIFQLPSSLGLLLQIFAKKDRLGIVGIDPQRPNSKSESPFNPEIDGRTWRSEVE